MLFVIPAMLFIGLPIILLMAIMDPPSHRAKNGGYWGHVKSFLDMDIMKEP